MTESARQRIAITTGEPAGIGPQVSLAAVAALRDGVVRDGVLRPVLIGDARMLAARARLHSIPVVLVDYDRNRVPVAGSTEVIDIPLAQAVQAGTLNAANAPAVIATLDRAIDGAQDGEFAAVVTAPVQKSVINDAGIAFSGHTEYFAARTSTPRVVMMLVGGGLRVALATTHLPLARVSAALGVDSLVETLAILDAGLKRDFALARPRILVCGLNPHAGEAGYLGREEIEVIAPALAAARAAGLDVRGPLPADTLFQPRLLKDCDAVLAMYHDQGLPVLKFASFGRGVNVTLGLPIIRTSVDHGTALDIAATSGFDAGSMQEALDLAGEMALRRRDR